MYVDNANNPKAIALTSAAALTQIRMINPPLSVRRCDDVQI